MTSQVDQWENSLAVKLPEKIVKELDLKVGDSIELSSVVWQNTRQGEIP